VDVQPTILQAVGVAVPQEVQGGKTDAARSELQPSAWEQVTRSERQECGAFRVETLPKRPIVCGFVLGVRRESTPAELWSRDHAPQTYALTLRALLELF
jgi:hypothetical protein